MAEIEIIEFYLIDQNEDNGCLTGSLSIRIPDLEMKILGVFTQRKKGVWYFSMPCKLSNDHRHPG